MTVEMMILTVREQRKNRLSWQSYVTVPVAFRRWHIEMMRRWHYECSGTLDHVRVNPEELARIREKQKELGIRNTGAI